jgi:predicted DNA binding CopG/RHH family protein
MNSNPVYPGDPGFTYLDDEERIEIEAIENAEMVPLQGQELSDIRARLVEAAQNTRIDLETKSERMNIRMTHSDMRALKAVAAREGLPYQSLVTSILHKYVTGALVDVREVRKVCAVPRPL